MESDRPPPVSVEIVYATLCNTQSLDTSMRTAAEEQLRSWERDAAPGFIGDLVKVISEVKSVPEVRQPRPSRHESSGLGADLTLM